MPKRHGLSIRGYVLFPLLLLLTIIPAVSAETPVQAAAKHVAARLAETLSSEALMRLDSAAILNAVSDEERNLFATGHWCFDVDVPALVSVMRDVEQETVPFWLEERGFHKTDLLARNDSYTYEVWQKEFPAGRVKLGINGFDRHRPHYFVAVGPIQAGTKVNLSNFFPEGQQPLVMREGTHVYDDWTELVLTEVPESLRGHLLLPTIRGRAREAHLAAAYRETKYPPTAAPDQIVLTWSGDPKTTQSVQWRTDTSVTAGLVRFREKGGPADAWREAPAEYTLLDDPLIVNGPRIHHFTARLADLASGTEYEYTVGAPDNALRSAVAVFRTEPPASEPFTFLFMSDTHNNPPSGELLADGTTRYPDTAFFTISGDLVGIGQYRDDWDSLFAHVAPFSPTYPFMPCVGNHDAIDGLGADLYVGLLDLPRNGPAAFEPERAYSFTYGDALFVMPDVMLSVQEQTPWMEKLFTESKAAWKFAIFHFPPYAANDATPDILEHWVPLFDRCGVDFVLSGHVHHYLRTLPMRDGKPAAANEHGTVYFITGSTNGAPEALPKPEYAAVMDSSGTPLYVAYTVSRDRVRIEARDRDGKLIDEWVVEKRP